LTVLLIEIHSFISENVKVDETTAVKGGSRQVGRIRVGVDGEENVDDDETDDDEPRTRTKRWRIYRGASWGGDVGGDDGDAADDG
jgi:hypothetical protein